MASIRDLRRRIRSVKNTSQITRAMQMVAASRMRKAQSAAINGRPYSVLMHKVLTQLTIHAGGFHHPLLQLRPVKRTGVIVVSSDRGLCGGLNSNLFREVLKFDPETTYFIAVGKKAAQFISRTKRNLIAEFNYNDPPLFGDARTVSRFAQDIFLNHDVDQVDVLFTDFVSTLVQKPVLAPFLPVGQVQDGHKELHGALQDAQLPDPKTLALEHTSEFVFEPDAETVFGAMLPHSLNFYIYHVLLEARASEHSARMVAMKTATDNASDLIKALTLEYNKVRQAAITKELLEITSAAMAAEG